MFLIQSNLNSSNTDGSFTIANSNSFFLSYVQLWYAEGTYKIRLDEAILMSTHSK